MGALNCCLSVHPKKGGHIVGIQVPGKGTPENPYVKGYLLEKSGNLARVRCQYGVFLAHVGENSADSSSRPGALPAGSLVGANDPCFDQDWEEAGEAAFDLGSDVDDVDAVDGRPFIETADDDDSDDESSDEEMDVKAILRAHNDLRARHGAPPLEWDDDCEAHAQLAAEECAAQDSMHHNNYKEYGDGQNLFCGMPAKDYGNAEVAIQSWYDEVDNPGYDFKNSGFSHGTGHFTQVVWVRSTKVGMAKAVSASGTVYIAANYSPAGNVSGQFGKNVLEEGSAIVDVGEIQEEPCSFKTSEMTHQLEAILNTIPYDDMAQRVQDHIAAGNPVQVDFQPSPNGSISIKYLEPGGGWSSENGTF